MGDNAKVNPMMTQPGCSPENPPPYDVGPPPQGHPPPSGHGTVLVGTAVIPTLMPMVIGPQMSPKPTTITCRSCNQEIVTKIEMRTTTRTHFFAALLCLVGCWPCVFVPYCMDSCKNYDHYCSNCNAYIGSYQN